MGKGGDAYTMFMYFASNNASNIIHNVELFFVVNNIYLEATVRADNFPALITRSRKHESIMDGGLNDARNN